MLSYSLLIDRMNRRKAVRVLGLGSLGLAGLMVGNSGCTSYPIRKRSTKDSSIEGPQDFSPIDRSWDQDVKTSNQFSGDDPERPHHIFLDKKNFLASRQNNVKTFPHQPLIVIVGGGISGLLCSYLLKDYQPLLLEQAQRLGGNSKGESWNKIEYSIGAAYYIKPEPGSPLANVLGELGVSQIQKEIKPNHSVFFQNKIYKNFWEGHTVKKKNAQFQILFRHFQDVLNNRAGNIYPEIPTKDIETRRTVNNLDRMNFLQYLQKQVDHDLHPHVFQMIESYCQSAFAAGAREISAASGLNFYSSEFATLCALPGGNATIAERLMQRSSIPAHLLQTGSQVIDIKTKSQGVEILFENQKKEVFRVSSKVAIVTSPKFVVSHLIDDLDQSVVRRIQSLQYRAYLVANLLLKKNIQKQEDLFGLYFLNENQGKIAEDTITDMIFADHVNSGDPSRSVLTLYWPISISGGRKRLLRGDSYSYHKAQFQRFISEIVLPMFGIKASDIYDLRLTRWGHALPLSSPGLIADRIVDEIRAPHKDRVFFVNQDNWMLPAFETCVAEALEFVSLTRKVLAGRS